jgi:FeS assembly protein IscX
MVQLDWLEVIDIAIELNEKYPDLDPQWISFPDLHKKNLWT